MKHPLSLDKAWSLVVVKGNPGEAITPKSPKCIKNCKENIGKRMRIIFPRELNKVFDSKFREGYWKRQIPEEDRSLQRQICYNHKNQEECTRPSFWGVSKPPTRTTVKYHLSPNVNVWMEFSSIRFYRVSFIDGNITSEKYLNTMDADFSTGIFKALIIQQDGTPVRYSHVDSFGTAKYLIGGLRERGQ